MQQHPLVVLRITLQRFFKAELKFHRSLHTKQILNHHHHHTHTHTHHTYHTPHIHTYTCPGPDEIKAITRCDLWNTGPLLCQQAEEFREKFIPPFSCSGGADGAYWSCWEDYKAVKRKSTFVIDQSFCFNLFKSPKECHRSTITFPLPAQLLGFSQTLRKGER